MGGHNNIYKKIIVKFTVQENYIVMHESLVNVAACLTGRSEEKCDSIPYH